MHKTAVKSFLKEAKNIAKALEGTWVAKPDQREPDKFILSDKEGHIVNIHFFSERAYRRQDQNKISIWGKLQDGRGTPPISCPITKTPGQVANDISRRLMPDYERSFEWCAKEITEEEVRAAEVLSIKNQIASAFGRKLSKEEIKPNWNRLYSCGDHLNTVEIYRGKIRAELGEVPVDKFLKIIEILKS